MIAAAVIVLIFVREPRTSKPEEDSSGTVRQAIRALWQTENHNGIWLLITIGLTFMMVESLQAGFSSFAVFVLGLPVAQAVRFAVISWLALVLSSFPSGLIGTRFGRKRTMSVGLAGMFLTAGICYLFVRSPQAFAVALALMGFFTALVVVNDLPLLYDIGGGNRIVAHTGVYFIATQSAAVLGPTLAGLTVDLAVTHRMIFAFAAVCALLAWATLQKIR